MSESPYVFDATIENFQEKVMQAQVPVVIDVWAEWCAPCKQLMPILTRLAEEYKGAFLLAKVNADEQQQLTGSLGVRSLPTVLVVKGGQAVDGFNGALPESEVRKILEKHVEAPAEPPLDQARRLKAEGDLEGALGVLRELNQANPEDYEVLTEIGLIQGAQGDLESARQILDSLPPEEKLNAPARQLAAQIRFRDGAGDLPAREVLEQRLADNPDDCGALGELAMHDILAGEYEAAMERLIHSVRVDRHFEEGAARKTLVELFDLLGNEDALARQYRRKLFALMY